MDGNYPVVLALAGKTCLVVGGGGVAERKAAGLMVARALVVVVSPAVTPGLASLAARGALRWERRPYLPGDLDGALLVFAAAGDPLVNRQVAEDCRQRGRPVNVADAPDQCDFFVPAALQRGRLSIAVSTGGASPALAACIRDALSGMFPDGWGPFLEFLAGLRERVRLTVSDPRRRREILERMAAPEVWDRLAQGDFTGAKERVDLVYRGGGG